MKKLVKPKKRYYFGKIQYGVPYFEPLGFVSSIIKIRKLERNTEERILELDRKDGWNKGTPRHTYTNYPIVRRAWNKIIRIFNTDYYVTIGKPFAIKKTELGWKDKWGTPRFEWCPQLTIYFFGLQFCIFWTAPDNDNDTYYEMKLWIENYHNGNIDEAEKEWDWINFETKKSTWNNNYIIES